MIHDDDFQLLDSLVDRATDRTVDHRGRVRPHMIARAIQAITLIITLGLTLGLAAVGNPLWMLAFGVTIGVALWAMPEDPRRGR